MNKKIISAMLTIFLTIALSLTFASAVKDFSLSPTSFTHNVNVNDGDSGTITISNTGDENLNLTISKTDLDSGSNTIALTITKTGVTDLAPGASTTVGFSYTAGGSIGTFNGKVTVNDGTQSKDSTITTTVANDVDGPSLTFEDWGSNLEMIIDIDDSSESETFYLVNNGNTTLLDIEIDLDSTFRGDEDDIDDNDFEINGEPGEDTYKINDEEGNDFELRPGDKYKIKLTLDIPSNLDVDDYKGDIDIGYLPKGDSVRVDQSFRLKIIAESDDDDVYIDQNSLYVRDGILTVVGEPGENIDDYSFIVINDASYDLSELVIKLDGDLINEDADGSMLSSVVQFDPNPVDVDERDEEEIDLEIDIPEDQKVGTYVADIELYTSTDKKLDEITLKIEVVGDIYIKEINYEETVEPGDKLNVEIVTVNQGSKVYRNVKVYGTLYDVAYGSGDIHESSNSFILDVNEEKTTTLRFSIPEEASHGEHTLEIRVRDDDGNEIVELEEIMIERPAVKIEIQSFAINPPIITCDDNQIYTYIKFQNLGRYDEEVIVSSEIKGTSIKVVSNEIEIDVDDIVQKNLILDVSSLDEEGTYTVIQKVINGNKVESVESVLKVKDCSEPPIITPPPEGNGSGNDTNETAPPGDGIGGDLNDLTLYLIIGLGIVAVFIVIGLFLL